MIESRKTIGCQIEILNYLITLQLLGYLMDTRVIFVYPGSRVSYGYPGTRVIFFYPGSHRVLEYPDTRAKTIALISGLNAPERVRSVARSGGSLTVFIRLSVIRRITRLFCNRNRRYSRKDLVVRVYPPSPRLYFLRYFPCVNFSIFYTACLYYYYY